MFYTLVFIALTEEKHLAPEGDGHVPADAAASSWLGSKRSQRWAGWLAAFLPQDRAEGPACEPLVLVIPTPPFPLVGQ